MDGILTNNSAKSAAQSWLRDFGAALAAGDATEVAALFADDCHWRDILAFTWDLRTTSGATSIAQRITSVLRQTVPHEVLALQIKAPLTIAAGAKPFPCWRSAQPISPCLERILRRCRIASPMSVPEALSTAAIR